MSSFPRRFTLIILVLILLPTFSAAGAVQWWHPAGLVTEETIGEVRDKLATQEWARKVYAGRKAVLDRWLAVPAGELKRVFPKKRGNVYHNFSCPQDRSRLKFDAFNPDRFECPSCGKTYDPQTDAGIYGAGDRYHGTMYDGWICLFFLEAGPAAADMGVVGRIEKDDRYFQRGIEILMLHAEVIEKLQTRPDGDPQMRVLLTYHREGDNKVLNDLACAYELLRDHMSPEQRSRFETAVLQRMYDDIMREPIYRYEHNNLYQWHRTIVQVGLCLQREDLIDWSMGWGEFDPAHQPEHRSIRRLAATHFKPDGAFWEMCSGYHLYPLHAFCELAVVSRNLSRMDPGRFPPVKYDLTSRENESSKAIRNGLHWFMSLAMPDRTMPTIGDSMAPRAGMDDYYTTAEVGYRFFGLDAVGDYERFRRGERSWAALLYGAPEIAQKPTPFSSSYLSSGWVSLRNEWKDNRVWVGLNALIPGGGHQHADRLGLTLYSRGKLLALEKATPYNENVTRELGTFTCSHNTVGVDKQSQPQGESLKGDQVPKVTHFFAGPALKFAELRGDKLYAQTRAYRRSVALVEDVVIDCFDVQGGGTHDWMLHHAGAAPQLSLAMKDAAAFEPASWLYNGTKNVRQGSGTEAWEARWKVDGVTSRLTMAGAPGTEVFALETYPIDNAVITKEHPACQTLCVRRTNDVPFVAVWDAWNTDIEWGDSPGSVALTTATGKYWMRFGPGESHFADGITLTSDGEFAMFAGSSAALVAGRKLECRTAKSTLTLTLDEPATISAEYSDGTVTLELSGDLHYDTYGGQDHYRPAPDVKATLGGDVWKVSQTRYRVGGKAD